MTLDGFARFTISIARTFVSGTFILLLTLAFALIVGVYAKLLWRAVRFGWDLML